LVPRNDMNSLNFNQVGGFPFTARILAEIQKAYTLFNALGAIAGDKTIISGCVTTGTIVSDGVVHVNGEVLEFIGGGLQSTVKIFEVVENLVFEDNTTKPVIKIRYVGFGTGIGAMAWLDFQRGFETKGLEATFESIHTSLSTIAGKLSTIQAGAQVQVASDWNATAGVNSILNKPDVVSVLHQGVFTVADPATDSLQTVTFPSIGTNNYMVLGSMVSTGSNHSQDNDVMWIIREKENASFKITLREINPVVQNLRFEYILIPL
jgi:hypothetical protein